MSGGGGDGARAFRRARRVAALDSVNVSKVANFIRARSKKTQFVMISLKEDAFKKSADVARAPASQPARASQRQPTCAARRPTGDALIGVYREQKLNASRVAHLDLTPYAF